MRRLLKDAWPSATIFIGACIAQTASSVGFEPHVIWLIGSLVMVFGAHVLGRRYALEEAARCEAKDAQ